MFQVTREIGNKAAETLEHINDEDVVDMVALSDLLVPFDLDGKRESSPSVTPSRYVCRLLSHDSLVIGFIPFDFCD